MPAVEATIVADGSLQTAPATFQRAGNNYEIVVDTSKIRFPLIDTVVEIQLSFDSFFVPKKKGSRRDDRELVVQAPRARPTDAQVRSALSQRLQPA
jgi:hypothetical protein